MSGPVVEARELEVRFLRPGGEPVQALNGIDLSVSAGEFVAVIGPSGAGKTTLLRSLTGFVRPTAGTLRVAGTDLTKARNRELYALRRQVTSIYQHFNLVERASALENVLYGCLGDTGTVRSLLGIFARRDRERAYTLLVRLGLEQQALQRVDRLSGGERQRVAIARALVQQPEVILADEPAASLDMELARLVLDALKDLHEGRGKTIMVNLHDLDLARQYAQRIVGLHRGRLVFDGPPEQLVPARVERIYAAG